MTDKTDTKEILISKMRRLSSDMLYVAAFIDDIYGQGNVNAEELRGAGLQVLKWARAMDKEGEGEKLL